jgi:hypothetical protein
MVRKKNKKPFFGVSLFFMGIRRKIKGWLILGQTMKYRVFYAWFFSSRYGTSMQRIPEGRLYEVQVKRKS